MEYLKQALELAQIGMGHVSPNPMVGAVLVKNERVIGTGFHKKYGQAHAEINAIDSATESVEGATLYCTLEPCCHSNKQTPPCVDRIISEKIAHVVVISLDPNKEVAGGGLKMLEAAGIKVSVDSSLAELEREMNEIYYKYISTKRPFVHLKWAQTIDGKIARVTGDSKWITCDKSREYVHYLRGMNQSILVGSTTAVIDNPSLNIRYGLDKKFPQPLRIVIGGLSKLTTELNIFKNQDLQKTIVVTSETNAEIEGLLTNLGIEVIKISDNSNGYLDLEELLDFLGERKISSIFVEGGAKVLSSFFREGLADKVSTFIAPKFFGEGIEAIHGLAFSSLKEYYFLDKVKLMTFRDDILMQGRPIKKS
ncbi:MAG: bifunctional diaminohydroxyphosphoribosylaminopyrimidine deaminase/5-amino-6-(5-phosphoribosylamino)uracil reductase RibD [Bacteriovoracaceae bacterium]|nr:bifunctional diaminohydroxyphosphoribosylaminopyrimidine deaminase/5-amino-6-(5-phosphoribosylamino)uracil reductase RibD [Bacteriovoracaceae bacterium]